MAGARSVTKKFPELLVYNYYSARDQNFQEFSICPRPVRLTHDRNYNIITDELEAL